MNIKNFDEFRQTIIKNFRWIKLEKDYAEFKLTLFQILELISYYERLIDLQKEIQSKHYQAIKQLENQDLLDGYNHLKWHHKRNEEISLWKQELDMLTEYKHHINSIIEKIEDGTVEKALAKQDMEF